MNNRRYLERHGVANTPVCDEDLDLYDGKEHLIRESVKMFRLFRPKIKRFAKTHTVDQCILKTGKWWEQALITSTAENMLDAYILRIFNK